MKLNFNRFLNDHVNSDGWERIVAHTYVHECHVAQEMFISKRKIERKKGDNDPRATISEHLCVSPALVRAMLGT